MRVDLERHVGFIVIGSSAKTHMLETKVRQRDAKEKAQYGVDCGARLEKKRNVRSRDGVSMLLEVPRCRKCEYHERSKLRVCECQGQGGMDVARYCPAWRAPLKAAHHSSNYNY